MRVTECAIDIISCLTIKRGISDLSPDGWVVIPRDQRSRGITTQPEGDKSDIPRFESLITILSYLYLIKFNFISI